MRSEFLVKATLGALLAVLATPDISAENTVSCLRFGAATLSLGDMLCAGLDEAGDEREVYRAQTATGELRFLFDAHGLMLILTGAELKTLAADPAQQALWLKTLPRPRLELWHRDALYWSHWLNNSDPRTMGDAN